VGTLTDRAAAPRAGTAGLRRHRVRAWLARAWHALVRLVARHRLVPRRPPGRAALPAWAVAGKRRRAHIRRVAALVEDWADTMGVAPGERARWLRAVWLHDALKDARLPGGIAHGVAAADRAEREGEADRGVLNAVRHHTWGHPAWDDVGKMLFLADYLEPGRRGRRKERARLAARVPQNRDAVLRRVLALQMRAALRAGRPIHPHTLELWNALATTRGEDR
jgi:HD superfamily phosphohydrolase YqeK